MSPPLSRSGSFKAAAVLAGIVGLLLAGAAKADVLNAYAPPLAWGPRVQLRAHFGPSTYTVTYTALGKTVVVGEVTYVGPDGKWTTERFNGKITFRTGNAVAHPKVRFGGNPLGTAVRVEVSP